MELKQRIELAIDNLQVLLDSEANESDFQNWFSQHSIAFDVLGYKNSIEHPSLFYEDKKYIPDFMAQTISDEWEIIELKTADASILKDADRRHAFFAATESNLSQCREYSLIFYDTACRAKFNEIYQTNCHKSPAVKLVIGRNDGTDKLLVNELLSGRSPRISIITYDDVINHLKARYETLKGIVDRPLGIYIVFTAIQIETSSTEDMYILDICKSGAKSRVEIYTSGKNIMMQTHDANGMVVSKMLSRFQDLNLLNAYEIVISPMQYETSIGLLINGELVLETMVRNTEFDFSGRLDIVFGSNQSGTAFSSMKTGGKIIIQGMPEPDERVVLRQFLESMQDEAGRRYMHEYVGHKFMHNQGHQALGSRMVHTTNMIQEIDAHKPTLRYL